MKNAIALGTFDGVHIGHRAVLDLPSDCKKIAVVFKRPPKSEIMEDKECLMTYEEKCRVMKKIGIDEIYPLEFEAVKDIEPIEFLNFLITEFSPSVISCGFNYRFGKSAVGNCEMLRSFCNENGIAFRCCPPVKSGETVVSSTEIRMLLKSGKISEANALLTEGFSFTGEVIYGDQRGRTIGFPTINQKYPNGITPLKFGVYKTLVCFDGCEYNGITNIGVRPTFLSDYIISETYIINFSGNLYGKNVTIKPLSFLRGEVKFSCLEDLQNQIIADINS